MGSIARFIPQSKVFWTNLLSMIFVTLGTQNFNFIRLLKAVDRAIENNAIREEVVAQIGNNKFQSEHIKCIPFLDKEAFNNYMNAARFIISHGGTGSIITALKSGKKVIVAPRLAKYDEHIDDHQLEILHAFTKMKLIIPLNRNLEDLEEKIKNIQQYKLNSFRSNSNDFNKNLTHLIKNF